MWTLALRFSPLVALSVLLEALSPCVLVVKVVTCGLVLSDSVSGRLGSTVMKSVFTSALGWAAQILTRVNLGVPMALKWNRSLCDWLT